MIASIFAFISSLILKGLISIGKLALSAFLAIGHWALAGILALASRLAVEARTAIVAEAGKILAAAEAKAQDLVAESELAIHEKLHPGS